MDKLGDPATIIGGVSLVTAIGSLVYTTNKINEVRKDLDEVTGHLATTIGERGTIDKMTGQMENLGKAVQILNNNIGEIVGAISAEQQLRNRQLGSILEFMKEVGDVPEETSALLAQKIELSTAASVHRPDNGFTTEASVRNGVTESLSNPTGDRRAMLRNLGIH